MTFIELTTEDVFLIMLARIGNSLSVPPGSGIENPAAKPPPISIDLPPGFSLTDTPGWNDTSVKPITPPDTPKLNPPEEPTLMPMLPRLNVPASETDSEMPPPLPNRKPGILSIVPN